MTDPPRIGLIDPAWRTRAQERLDSLTKPIGSLGRLEELVSQFIAAREEDEPFIQNPAVYVFAADHGVTAEGVSAYPAEVTAQMVQNFLAGGAAINVLARAAQAEVIVIDIGVATDLAHHPRLLHRKIRQGTRNMIEEPAMTEAEASQAMEVGLQLAIEANAAGRTLVAAGEMGIGNTTSASAITALLTGARAIDVTGPGAGLTPAALQHKIDVVDKAVAMHASTHSSPHSSTHASEILRRVGGLEIAGLTGLILGAASRRIPIVLDGFISTSAAALAFAINPAVQPYLFAGHRSPEPGHQRLLKYLQIKPILDLEMRLGEGTGALLAISIIQSALALYNQMATFESAQVSRGTK